MPDLESLFINILARFGVDPAAGDLAADGPTEWPEPAESAGLTSPYACKPTEWGVGEIPEPPAEAEERPTAAERPASRGYDAPRRRLALSVDREPPPRGLLVT